MIFALAGMEIPLCAGGEIRDPGRTVPRALAAATLLVVLLYVTIQLIAQGVLGPALAGSSAPLADALAGLGPAGRGLILAIGAISMVGFLGGDILGQSRVLFAFARDGLLPRKLAAVHPTTRAPHVAVVVNAVVAASLAMSGSFTLLAPVASIAIVLLYIATCVAAWLVTRREPRRVGTLPGATALLAIPGLTWVLAQSTRQEFLAVVLALAAGAATYAVTTRFGSAEPLRTDLRSKTTPRTRPQHVAQHPGGLGQTRRGVLPPKPSSSPLLRRRAGIAGRQWQRGETAFAPCAGPGRRHPYPSAAAPRRVAPHRHWRPGASRRSAGRRPVEERVPRSRYSPRIRRRCRLNARRCRAAPPAAAWYSVGEKRSSASLRLEQARARAPAGTTR